MIFIDFLCFSKKIKGNPSWDLVNPLSMKPPSWAGFQLKTSIWDYLPRGYSGSHWFSVIQFNRRPLKWVNNGRRDTPGVFGSRFDPERRPKSRQTPRSNWGPPRIYSPGPAFRNELGSNLISFANTQPTPLSLENTHSLWFSLKTKENQWFSLKIKGNEWKSLIFLHF